jgi:hypothetical protein
MEKSELSDLTLHNNTAILVNVEQIFPGMLVTQTLRAYNISWQHWAPAVQMDRRHVYLDFRRWSSAQTGGF